MSTKVYHSQVASFLYNCFRVQQGQFSHTGNSLGGTVIGHTLRDLVEGHVEFLLEVTCKSFHIVRQSFPPPRRQYSHQHLVLLC
ncbi:hypothetical protein FKM82_007529 [Ascaphus truei]